MRALTGDETMKPYRLQEPKMPLFFKLWFTFVALLVVSIFAGTVYVIGSALQAGPEGLGRAIGAVIKGIDDGRK